MEGPYAPFLTIIFVVIPFILILVCVFVLKTDTLKGISAQMLNEDEEEIDKLFFGHTKSVLSGIIMLLLILGLLIFWVW